MKTRNRIALTAGTALVLLAGVGLALQSMSGDRTGGGEGSGAEMDRDEMADMEMGNSPMDGSVHLSAEEVATFGVTFGTADVRPLSRTIRAVGIVEFDETRMAYVAPRFGGWAEQLHVDFTGQRVMEGRPLLDVYSPELVTAQEELLLASRMVESLDGSRVESAFADARELLDAARRRLEYWEISNEQVERLLETGEVTRTLTLHSPASGVVMEKDVVEGEAFEEGRNLYMIADLSRVWVNAEIFEADAALVREGMPARLSVAALPGQEYSGTVEYVYPTLEEGTRSMRARVVLDNPGGALKPGMYATVRLTAELGELLTVPRSAVLHSGERDVAFVDMGDGALEPREVRLGVSGTEHVHVVEGVEAGERVVTSAQFLLDSESNLAEVVQAMMAQMNMSDMDGMDMGEMDDMDAGGMDMDGTDTPPEGTGGN